MAGKPPTPGGGGFKRELGFWSLLFMSLGTVIGSGWLLLPGVVASKAGPAALYSWIIAGLCMLVIGLVYSEMGAAWPAPGAVAKYPYLSHGRFTGHLAGWAALVSYVIIPPAEAVAVTRYAGTYVPSFLSSGNHLSTLGLLVAIAILAVIGWLNWIGVKYLAAFQNWVTVLKYIPIAFFLVGVGFFAFHPANFTQFGGWMPTGASGIMLGTASTLFAYLGFRQALDFGAEARNPGRDMPLAIVWTIILAMVTYILIDIVFIGGINWAGLAQWGVSAGDWNSLGSLPAPLYNLAAAAGVGVVAWLIFVDGIVSPNGPNATNVGSVPRVAYTMAEDGTMPNIFLRLHPLYGTPGPGLLICFLIEVFFLLLSTGGYSFLIDAINVAFMVAYGIGPVAFGTLRKTASHVKRPFRLSFGNILAPLAFFLASLLLYWSQWPMTGEVLGVLFVGVLIYLYYVAQGEASWESVSNGYWLIVYLIVMAAISYFGDTHFGGTGAITMPWDIVSVFVVSVILYYWGTSQGIEYNQEHEPDSADVEYIDGGAPVSGD